jgi:hypothetical protein
MAHWNATSGTALKNKLFDPAITTPRHICEEM